jgi:hypothetical protein
MFILRDLLQPLQAHFSDTDLGRERSSLFAYTLLAVIVPFTSSITSNLLRSLVTLFGIEIKKKRFYTFMASSTLPWQKLWQTVWGLIPSPETEGRLLVALDDCINPKIGKTSSVARQFLIMPPKPIKASIRGHKTWSRSVY